MDETSQIALAPREEPERWALLGIVRNQRDRFQNVRLRNIDFACGCFGYWFRDGTFLLHRGCRTPNCPRTKGDQ